MKVDLKPMLAMHREDFLKMTHQEPQMENTEDSTWVGEMIFELVKQRNMLEKKNKLYEAYMIKWDEELGISGINSKASVRAEIEKVLEDMKNG